MVMHSRSSLQNASNGRFWIRKYKEVLLTLIKKNDSESLIDKVYLYGKGSNRPKYQFLIKNREDVAIRHLNDPKAFTEY